MDENTNNENQDILEELDDSARNGTDAPKKIEVIKGNGDLTISPVYEHLEVEKPKPKENRTIFIPEVKKELIQETFEDSKTSKDSENTENSESSESSEESEELLDSESLADLENFKNLNNLNNSRNSDD